MNLTASARCLEDYGRVQNVHLDRTVYKVWETVILGGHWEAIL